MTAQHEDLEGKGLQPGVVNLECFCDGYDAVATAFRLAARVDQFVLGSLQGQQLLQSCMSMLLTYSSLLHSTDRFFTPASLLLCVQLLQLLQWTEALAAGDSSCAMSHSHAAGTLLVGRGLQRIATRLSPSYTSDKGSSKSSSNGSKSSNRSAPSPVQQGIKFRVHIQDWLSSLAFWQVDQASHDADDQLQQMTCAKAGRMQQAVQDLFRCMFCISQTVQQSAALDPVMATAMTAADACPAAGRCRRK
mgnify:CR=1 FL=1